jgi:hypothetical protein
MRSRRRSRRRRRRKRRRMMRPSAGSCRKSLLGHQGIILVDFLPRGKPPMPLIAFR